MGDPTGVKIDELIAAADDSSTRQLLMVLSRINDSLEENTLATSKIADAFMIHQQDFFGMRARFETHMNQELGMMRAGKWAASIGGVLCTIIISMSTYIVLGQQAVTADETKLLREVTQRIFVLETMMGVPKPKEK